MMHIATVQQSCHTVRRVVLVLSNGVIQSHADHELLILICFWKPFAPRQIQAATLVTLWPLRTAILQDVD